MSNQITTTNLQPVNGYVAGSSRYVNSDIIYYGDLNKLTFTTYVRQPFVRSQQDMFTMVTAGTQYRPDLISMQMYGTVDFWWRIMEVNKIYDVFDLKIGLTLRLPGNVYGL